MKLGEHLNSLLLNMCDDVTLSRMSLRTVLDICSKHIRNSTCDPPFSYVRKLVRLVLGSLSQVQYLRFSSSRHASVIAMKGGVAGGELRIESCWQKMFAEMISPSTSPGERRSE